MSAAKPADEKLGRPFERLVAAVQKKLDPGSEIHSPYVVAAKSGSRITLDAAVVGKVGSAQILIAIEAKDYSTPVGVEQVRAFFAVQKDARADHAIMVAAEGFTRDALLTAEEFGIETCVLRPARDEDWENLIRHVSVKVVLMKHVYRDACIELTDGRRVAVPEHGRVPLIVGTDDLTSFDAIVNGGILKDHKYDNRDIFISPDEDIWYPEGPHVCTKVSRLLCRREQTEGARQDIFVTSPADYVFVRQTSRGHLDERRFLEFRDLDKLAESFRSK